MKNPSSTDSIECAQTIPLPDMPKVLEQQEAALLQLESALVEKRWALVNAEPENVLETLQRVETLLARLEQLESARTRLSNRPAAGADRLDDPGGDCDSSAPAGIWDVRYRILGAIARIAAMNAANEHLVAGLSRTSGVAIGRLSQLENAGPTGPTSGCIDNRRPTLDFRA